MSAPSEHLRATLARYETVKHLPAWRALAAEKRWLAWSFGEAKPNGKRGKLPRSCVTGSSRGWSDHHALATLDEAFSFAQSHRCDGVGLCPGSPNGAPALWIGDLDSCASRDAEGQLVITPDAKAFLNDKEAAWIELSPSGRGLRTIARGTVKSVKSVSVEVFGDSGFCTVTFQRLRGGDTLETAPRMLAKLQAAITAAGGNASTSNASQRGTQPAAAPARVPPARLSSLGRRYVSEAVGAILDELREAQDGGRNHALNQAAFSCGQFVGAGALDADEARDNLSAVAQEIGLEADEIAATIASGLRSGQAQPRQLDPKHLRRDASDGDAILDPWASSDIAPAPSFPRKALPHLIECYLTQAARTMGADEDAALALAPLIFCAACPADLTFAPRPATPWRVPATIFAALVGASGVAKTPIFDGLLWPVKEADREHAKAFAAATERAMARQRRKSSDVAEDAPAPVPRRRQRLVTSATVEGVKRLAMQTGDGVLLYSDEMRGFFAGLDAYKNTSGFGSADRASWLSAYNGDVDATVRASEDKSTFIARFTASVFGGVQPKILAQIMPLIADGDGLVERFLFVPQRAAGFSTREAIGAGLRENYGAAVRRVLDATRVSGASVPVLLQADDDAVDVSFAAEKWALEEMAKLHDEDPLRGVLAKTRGTVARIAIGLHMLDWTDKLAVEIALGEEEEGEHTPPETVNGETAQRAFDLFRSYYWPAIEDVMAGAREGGQARSDLQRLATICLALPPDGVLSKRTVRDGWNGAANPRRWEAAIDALIEGGWIEEADRRGGGERYKMVLTDEARARFASRAR